MGHGKKYSGGSMSISMLGYKASGKGGNANKKSRTAKMKGDSGNMKPKFDKFGT